MAAGSVRQVRKDKQAQLSQKPRKGQVRSTSLRVDCWTPYRDEEGTNYTDQEGSQQASLLRRAPYLEEPAFSSNNIGSDDRKCPN